MHRVQFEEPSQTETTDQDSPPIVSFKELLDARQKKLDEKSKSLGNLSMKKPLEISPSKTKLPPLKTKQQSSILKKLTYDFGSLNEFLSYDLKLKKPEELFKVSGRERKLELKNKEEDLKKGLMQHMKQEVDNRDPRTILMEEKDPEKVLKAAKRFIGDMMTEVFKDDIHLLEKKHGHKGMNKLYELLMDLEEDNPVRKVVEKYGYKSLPEKFSILEGEIEKKKNPENQFASNLKKHRSMGNKNILQSFVGPSDSIAHSPLDLGTFKQSSQKGILSTGKPHISNRITNRQNGISTGARGNDIYIYSDLMGSNENKSGSPKSRKKEISESEKMAFAMKLIIGSSSLELILREHEKDEKGKEEYNKLIKQAEDNEKAKFMNLYALKDNEKISSISSSHIVVTHAPYKPQFFFHLYLKYTTFPSLLILNLRGCGIHESLVWFALNLVEKYSTQIRHIDFSGNHISLRICEIFKEMLINMDLKTLKLANVGLKSKGLAIMCLGLARNNTLSELDLNYNEIDESGFKTLALILRHTKSLQSMKILRKKKIVTTSMGEEKEAEDELGYNAMAAFTKAFKHNKFLDPTNILIFESK